MECPYCKGTDIIQGYLMSGYQVHFVPLSEKRRLVKDTYAINVCVCKDCGMFVGFKLRNPEKLI